jgi:hypothetical protein
MIRSAFGHVPSRTSQNPTIVDRWFNRSINSGSVTRSTGPSPDDYAKLGACVVPEQLFEFTIDWRESALSGP